MTKQVEKDITDELKELDEKAQALKTESNRIKARKHNIKKALKLLTSEVMSKRPRRARRVKAK